MGKKHRRSEDAQIKTEVQSESSQPDESLITLREFDLLNVSNDPLRYLSSSHPSASICEGDGQHDSSSSRRLNFPLEVVFVSESSCGMSLEFDLIGCDASFANALRRILISDIASMAVERVHIYNNTSLIQDEVLAHRLGLIPLKADANLFVEKKKTDESAADLNMNKPVAEIPSKAERDWCESHGDYGSSRDTLVYDLKVKCEKSDVTFTSPDTCNSFSVTTKSIVYVAPPQSENAPANEQSEQFGVVHDDILIAKLRPGQVLDIRMFAHKGYGSDHAKFSPVATAYYRLMPSIKINKEIRGADAILLQSCFNKGVIGLENVLTGEQVTSAVASHSLPDVKLKHMRAYVADSRREEVFSRNCFRYAQFNTGDAVELGKVADHFIFRVESVGAVKSRELVRRAILHLQSKCDHYLRMMASQGDRLDGTPPPHHSRRSKSRTRDVA